MNFKFCKGNTKGRRRGGRGAVPAPKKSVSKNRGTLRRRVSPFSLPLGFPSALSFLTHPHSRLDFCTPSHCAIFRFIIVTVRATLIMYNFLWCAQPTSKLIISTLNVEIVGFSFVTSIYTSGRLVIDSNSHVNLREISDPSENLKIIQNSNYQRKMRLFPTPNSRRLSATNEIGNG